AAHGEIAAERLLAAQGYLVLGRQVARAWTVLLDPGGPVCVHLRADLLVEKGRRRFVAEVKTGTVAPRIESPPTRRPLLEYRLAFDVDGGVLVDADTGSIREVSFALPGLAARAVPSRSIWLLVGLVLGAVVATSLADRLRDVRRNLPRIIGD